MRRLALLLLLCFPPALAADFYISTTGSDSNTCTNQTTDACASFPRCNAVMAAGDTCYALGGTYTTSGLRGWNMTGTGGTAGNVKTFRGMPNQTAIIQPASYLNATQEGTITIYNATLDYVTFSDFTHYGRFDIHETLQDGADHLTLERIVFKCPGAAGTGNTTCIEGQNLLDGSNNVPREYLTIRDNLFTIDSTCPDYSAYGSSTSYQPDFMHLYANSHPTVENNDFIIDDYTKLYNRGGDPDMRFAVWLKGQAEYAAITKNYCSGEFGACYNINTGKCPDGYTCNGFDTKDSAGQNAIYQNISDRAGSLGWDSANWNSEDLVYNNTIYRPWGSNGGISISPTDTSDLTRARIKHSIFNNLVIGQAGDSLGGYYGYIYIQPQGTQGTQIVCLQNFIDYNMYYPVDSAKTANFRSYTVTANTLAAWQSWLTANCTNAFVRETGSRTADPLFVDPANHDFHLQGASPALSGGRGGSYSEVLGAYITGSEAIGCTFHPSCYSYNVAEAPSTSGNPRRVDMRGVSFK